MLTRIKTYWLTGTSLTLIYILLAQNNWQGTAQLHTLMETVATVLGLFVGSLALIHFYSQRDNKFLIIGAGFIGVAFLDGYHATVTSIWFKSFSPSDLSSLIPWSWLASRLFLSIIILSSILIIRMKIDKKHPNLIRPCVIYSLTILATMISFLFFAFVPLPNGYYESTLIYRPEEYLPALFFLIALIFYIKDGSWIYHDFEHWLIIGIIINLVAQISVMPYSSHLFDIQFDLAHIFKKLSPIIPLKSSTE